MSSEAELRELEAIWSNPKHKHKVKHFKGNNEIILERRFQKFVNKHHVLLSLLICRKRKYTLYYD